jgi:hypothetical protein
MLIHAIAVAIHRFATHYLHATAARRRFIEDMLVNLGLALSILLVSLLLTANQ